MLRCVNVGIRGLSFLSFEGSRFLIGWPPLLLTSSIVARFTSCKLDREEGRSRNLDGVGLTGADRAVSEPSELKLSTRELLRVMRDAKLLRDTERRRAGTDDKELLSFVEMRLFDDTEKCLPRVPLFVLGVDEDLLDIGVRAPGSFGTSPVERVRL